MKNVFFFSFKIGSKLTHFPTLVIKQIFKIKFDYPIYRHSGVGRPTNSKMKTKKKIEVATSAVYSENFELMLGIQDSE